MTKTMTSLAIAAALTALPAIAAAKCNHGKYDQAQSCATGSTYDSASGKCVPVSSS